ncbi:hypothetical protein H696_02054 [Fonticula alba]|uniref:Uncharacterized protein n=1 Tax=Fonticula alba TaxID=691883 RepID=A0A058ZB08_FONAL|nr:hypothetical protein H696_02054 [Fonticula alba]KCV71108.1 hypothetical protein H696_02054 [Fonticula alba]|eukprot:XP_009494231.1 hypothetical protein H696_02054 [Fonticula alba]
MPSASVPLPGGLATAAGRPAEPDAVSIALAEQTVVILAVCITLGMMVLFLALLGVGYLYARAVRKRVLHQLRYGSQSEGLVAVEVPFSPAGVSIAGDLSSSSLGLGSNSSTALTGGMDLSDALPMGRPASRIYRSQPAPRGGDYFGRLQPAVDRAVLFLWPLPEDLVPPSRRRAMGPGFPGPGPPPPRRARSDEGLLRGLFRRNAAEAAHPPGQEDASPGPGAGMDPGALPGPGARGPLNALEAFEESYWSVSSDADAADVDLMSYGIRFHSVRLGHDPVGRADTVNSVAGRPFVARVGYAPKACPASGTVRDEPVFASLVVLPQAPAPVAVGRAPPTPGRPFPGGAERPVPPAALADGTGVANHPFDLEAWCTCRRGDATSACPAHPMPLDHVGLTYYHYTEPVLGPGPGSAEDLEKTEQDDPQELPLAGGSSSLRVFSSSSLPVVHSPREAGGLAGHEAGGVAAHAEGSSSSADLLCKAGAPEPVSFTHMPLSPGVSWAPDEGGGVSSASLTLA